MSDSQAAPGRLDLVREFLNTYDVMGAKDALTSTDALAEWLSERSLIDASGRFDDRDLDRALDFREALRGLLLANIGEDVDPAVVARLNAAAERARVVVRFSGDAATSLDPHGTGADRAIGALLSIVYTSMAEGTWRRLKVCRDHDCQWAFYDHSKNRSGTWCTMAVCGNRNKARAYRKRQ